MKEINTTGTTALVALFGRAIAFECLNNRTPHVKIRSLDLRHKAQVPRSSWIRLLREQGKINASKPSENTKETS